MSREVDWNQPLEPGPVKIDLPKVGEAEYAFELWFNDHQKKYLVSASAYESIRAGFHAGYKRGRESK